MISEKVNEVQYLTVKDTLDKLEKYGICLMVRPTGFGKTKISSMIMDNYKNIIYCYPLKNIMNSVSQYNNNESIIFISYQKLCRLYNDKELFINKFSKYDLDNTLFVFDEAHFIGASKTSACINELMKVVCTNAHFLGLTATPLRTDDVNIETEYFNAVSTYDYTLKDAFNDYIYIKPYYVYCTLNDDSLYKLLLYKVKKSNIPAGKKSIILERIKNQIDIQILTIENLDFIIKKHLETFKNDRGYYKFICFFSTIQNLHNKENEVIKAFKKVFKNCNVRSIVISSENNEYKHNLNLIDKMNTEDNTVDLIFNVNMLTFGYHVSNITGVMLFRPTRSHIVYTQQTGRGLSVVQNHQTIIFDFVENMNKIGNIDFDFDDITSENVKDKLDIISSDNIILDENTRDFIEILQMIEGYNKNNMIDEVIRAYKAGLVDIEYCIKKLKVSYDEFIKILRRYEN